MLLFWIGYGALAVFTAFIVIILMWPQLLPSNPARKRALVAVVLFTCASTGLYALVGNPAMLSDYAAREAAKEEAIATIAEKEKALRINPDKLQDWVALGEAAMKAGRPGQAVAAYRRATFISAGDPAIMLAFGKAQVVAAGGKVNAESALTFKTALEQVEDPQARLFLAMYEIERNEPDKARKQFKALIDAKDTPEAVRKAAQEQLGQMDATTNAK